MSAERTFQHPRRPPDVEEALLSMLWTPYEHTSTESSSDEDDDRCRINRLHKSHSSYDHQYAYEPLTRTRYEVANRLFSPAAKTTVSTTTNVANALRSTPYVPLTNFFYNNRNNSDSSGDGHSESIKIGSNRKQTDSFRDGSLRFSYPYYGPIPSLNKWWAPSIGSKEPPSYESLYAKYSVKSKVVVPDTNDANSKCINTDKFTTIKSTELDGRKADKNFESPKEWSSQPLGHLEKILSTAASEARYDNVHHIVDNSNDSNNFEDVSHNKDNEETSAKLNEILLTNSRSQQTEKYNNKINAGNNNGQNDDDANKGREKIQVKQHHQQGAQLQHANSSQSIAMARAIAATITVNTSNTTEVPERAKTTTFDGEEVSQPVSFVDCNEISLLSSDLRTSTVNNQKCKNNIIGHKLNTNSMNGVCSNNRSEMNTAGVCTFKNLFAESQSDKAINVERAYGRDWESNFTEIYADPPMVDAVTIIQSVSRSFDGRLDTCRSRSSFAALPSYSHLWEKTLNSVRSKVKRVSRPKSEIVPPSEALTPNKCLAELERLYAEFRASESALAATSKDADKDSRSIESRQHCLNHSRSDSGDSSSNCADGCELLTAISSVSVANVDLSPNMRLSVPVGASFRSSAAELRTQQVQTSKVLPSQTSSVFLGSPNYVAASCTLSNDRQRSSSFSSDDRCSNLLHETKHNNGNCSNSEKSQEISNENVVVAAIENDNTINNSAAIPVLATSAIRNQTSLTIHVNSVNSDQNNNSNCIYNKNNRNIYNLTNNFVDNSNNNDRIGVEAALKNVKVYVQQESIVQNNGVSVVNCNYSNAYPTNNAITITPVSSVSVNKSGDSEVSIVPNNIYNGKNNTARSDSNGNEIEIGNSADNVKVINLNPSPTSTHRVGVQQWPNTTTTFSSTNELSPSQTDHVPRSASFPPVVVSEQARTFTSTECQTDEIPSAQLRCNRVPVSPVSNRVQRRRDRRERRQLQQQLSSSYPNPQHLHMPSVLRRPQDRHSMPLGPLAISGITAMHLQSSIHHTTVSASTTMPSTISTLLRPVVPDLLHRHFPPPYSAVPLNNCSTSGVSPSPPPTIVGPIPPPPLGTTLLTPVISTVPMPGVAPPVVNDGCFTLPLPIIRRSPSERSGKGCCGKWFAGPPLRALIAVVALGGIACTLGGAALGATGLTGPPTSHLTAALLMIGVGVVLVTVSGAAWRMTAPGGPPCLGLRTAVDLRRCGRRPCGRGGGNAHGLLYPEFQHRPPPPSYQASMQEYRLRLLLLDRDRQNGVVRGNSPPPTYRSYTGSLLRTSLTTSIRSGGITGSIASEYSLPPSYRSRNITPTTISSGHSVDIAPSDRLLANEVIAEQCSTQESPNSQTDSPSISPAERPSVSTAEKSQGFQQHKHSRSHQVQTSAIVEIEATNNRTAQLNSENVNEVNKEGQATALNSTAHKELVTIVTISKNDTQSDRNVPCGGEHIEILAHL